MIRIRFKPAALVIPLGIAVWGAIGMGAAFIFSLINGGT